MRLTVIGSAPAFTRRAGHASSCYLVEEGESAIVLDLGQGAFAPLAGRRAPETLGGVLVSHLHPDHFVDLVPLRHYLKYGAAGGGAIAVHGPADLPVRLDGLLGEPGFMPPLVFSPLAPGTFEVGGFAVEARLVTHIADAYAFRVRAARAAVDEPGLVYSGDCAVADDLLPLIRPTDTLLCEASFGDGAAGPIHLTAAQAGRVAARSGAAQLLLTHIHDEREPEAAARAAAAEFAGHVAVASPGLELTLP